MDGRSDNDGILGAGAERSSARARLRLAVGLSIWMTSLALAAAAAPATPQAEPVAGEPAAERVSASTVAVPVPESKLHNPDPWEPFNRGVFFLNEWGDILIVTPLAEGWRFMTPTFFRSLVTHFNDNLRMPVILGNNVLQLKPRHVGDDFLRMIFNLSFGLAGLIDVASAVDIPQNDEDFGQTLGYWGAPTGPYLVLPVFGPSNVRDAIGRAGDSAGTLYFSFLPFYSTLAVSTLDVVNLRSGYIEEIDANRVESFDYYIFLRNAYLQNRRAKVGVPGSRRRDAEPDEDLYHYDDEDADEDFDEDFDQDFDE